MSLPLHHVRAFLAVIEAGGFSRAAETLHVSQPAISKNIRQLEAQLGTVLIDRAAGGVHLTPAGEILHARAREIFAVARAAETELRLLQGLEAGALSVGASTTIAAYHLPPLLARFQAAHPAIAVTLISANTRDVAASLLDRRIDIALVEGPVADARLSNLVWRQDDMVLIAGAGDPLAGANAVPPHALADALFVMREPGSGSRLVAESILARLAVAPRRILQAGSAEAVTRFVAAGAGIAVVPASSAADQIALGRVRVLRIAGHEAFTRDLYELRLPGRAESAAATAFGRLLRGAPPP